MTRVIALTAAKPSSPILEKALEMPSTAVWLMPACRASGAMLPAKFRMPVALVPELFARFATTSFVRLTRPGASRTLPYARSSRVAAVASCSAFSPVAPESWV